MSINMYLMDTTYEAEEFDTFAQLRQKAEAASDVLNFPICWYLYHEGVAGWHPSEGREFTLVFLMPRKYGTTWGVTTRNFDPQEVQEWLDTFIRGEVMKWYGWC